MKVNGIRRLGRVDSTFFNKALDTEAPEDLANENGGWDSAEVKRQMDQMYSQMGCAPVDSQVREEQLRHMRVQAMSQVDYAPEIVDFQLRVMNNSVIPLSANPDTREENLRFMREVNNHPDYGKVPVEDIIANLMATDRPYFDRVRFESDWARFVRASDAQENIFSDFIFRLEEDLDTPDRFRGDLDGILIGLMLERKMVEEEASLAYSPKTDRHSSPAKKASSYHSRMETIDTLGEYMKALKDAASGLVPRTGKFRVTPELDPSYIPPKLLADYGEMIGNPDNLYQGILDLVVEKAGTSPKFVKHITASMNSGIQAVVDFECAEDKACRDAKMNGNGQGNGYKMSLMNPEELVVVEGNGHKHNGGRPRYRGGVKAMPEPNEPIYAIQPPAFSPGLMLAVVYTALTMGHGARR